MPFIRIALAGQEPAPARLEQLQDGLTGLMADILGKRREVTVAAVTVAPAGLWSIGGKPLDGASAQVEAFITAGTNSSQEKAAFIRAAHCLLLECLPGIRGPIYILVHEIPATDWGYDGATQAARMDQARAL